MNWIMQFWPTKRLSSRPVDQGAIGMVNASIVLGEGSHGKYMTESKIRAECSSVRSEEGRMMLEQVWKETRAALQEIAPSEKAK